MSFCAQIDFPGTMYITDKHTCFNAFSGSVSFSLPHKAKQTVKKMLQGVGSGALLTTFRASAMRSSLHTCPESQVSAESITCRFTGTSTASNARMTSRLI
jgi:hypothetical protein